MSAIAITYKVNVKLPETKQTARQKLARIDYAGSFTLVVCIGCLLLGLSLKTSEDLNWNNGLVIGLLCGSGVFAVAFVYAEARWAPEPVMPLRLLAMRTPLFVALSNLLVLLSLVTQRAHDMFIQFCKLKCILYGACCARLLENSSTYVRPPVIQRTTLLLGSQAKFCDRRRQVFR